MAVIFDGRAFAKEKETKLIEEVKKLNKKGIKPKLVSILVGNDPGSTLYVNLKKKAAERIGAEVEIVSLQEEIGTEELKKMIGKFNANKVVHGVMIQLPLPPNFSKGKRDEIINTITKKKDVDGLRDDSPFLTPTVKSVLEAIKEATPYISLKNNPLKVVVVGAGGFEGRKILKVLKEMGYEVEGADKRTKNLRLKTKNADILISVTGSRGIIGKEEVKEGAVVIDVGSPKADVRTEEILEKASFISPVPGGIGPVTISCLLENLVKAARD